MRARALCAAACQLSCTIYQSALQQCNRSARTQKWPPATHQNKPHGSISATTYLKPAVDGPRNRPLPPQRTTHENIETQPKGIPAVLDPPSSIFPLYRWSDRLCVPGEPGGNWPLAHVSPPPPVLTPRWYCGLPCSCAGDWRSPGSLSCRLCVGEWVEYNQCEALCLHVRANV